MNKVLYAYAKMYTDRIEKKLLNFTVNENGCHIWQGAKSVAGYGVIRIEGTKKGVHRLILEMKAGGFLPKHLFACHTCDTPSCINPDHLFVGTIADNNSDAAKKGRNVQQKKTHCLKGHPLSGDNLTLSRGHRRCKKCDALSSQAYREAKCSHK